MVENPRFYAVIIGTEILNGRREDAHFNYLRDALSARGYTLFATHIIKDDIWLIEQTYRLILSDPHAVMFSFGGIGSTPDDLTRQIAASIFTGRPLQRHLQFEKDIIERFGDEAYPYRIHMSDLPENAQLLKNPVNNMSGFYLDERYFFVPGFPQMAHPMIDEAISRFYPKNQTMYRRTLLAQTSENTLITLMLDVPADIELSSLPMLKENVASVELSVASSDLEAVEACFREFTDFLDRHKIAYTVSEPL